MNLICLKAQSAFASHEVQPANTPSSRAQPMALLSC